MGKRKIQIEKIESQSKLQVTFSKRRKGLFGKAAEFCRLSDAQIALIVFSPAGKPFCFGHSSVDSVINRYYNGGSNSDSNSTGSDSDSNHNRSEDQSVVFDQIRDLELNLRKMEEERTRFWWEKIQVEEINSLEKLEVLDKKLSELRENVLNRLDQKQKLEEESSRRIVDPNCSDDEKMEAFLKEIICDDDVEWPVAVEEEEDPLLIEFPSL